MAANISANKSTVRKILKTYKYNCYKEDRLVQALLPVDKGWRLSFCYLFVARTVRNCCFPNQIIFYYYLCLTIVFYFSFLSIVIHSEHSRKFVKALCGEHIFLYIVHFEPSHCETRPVPAWMIMIVHLKFELLISQIYK